MEIFGRQRLISNNVIKRLLCGWNTGIGILKYGYWYRVVIKLFQNTGILALSGIGIGSGSHHWCPLW